MRRRRRGAGPWAVAAVVSLALALGAALVLSNPRHRAFYLGLLSEPTPPPSAEVAGPERPATVVPAPTAARPRRAGAAGSTPRAGFLVDPRGLIRIPMADRVPSRLPMEGVPAGWKLKEFAGRATVELVRTDAGVAMRLRSAHSSFAVYRDVVVDLREQPFLAWSWKVVRLPAAGDVRERRTDDEAAQIYVIFPRWPSPLTASDVIGYVWDTRAPVGTSLVSPAAANVRIVVVESGRGGLDRWQHLVRNVAEDYRALFGRSPPRVGQVALMIDTDDTRGEAEALFADLVFSPRPADRVETPTSMLR